MSDWVQIEIAICNFILDFKELLGPLELCLLCKYSRTGIKLMKLRLDPKTGH